MKRHTVSEYVRMVLFGLCVIGICVFAVLIYKDRTAFYQMYDENAKQLVSLQSQLDGIQTDVSEPEDVKVTLNSARTVGNRIADLQNQYTARMKKQIKSPSDEDGYYSDLDKISSELDTYFGKDSVFRGSWYMGDVANVDWTWSFCTNYSFLDNTIPVLWMCESGNDLIGYVSGQYHVDTNTVDGLSKQITSIGMSYYAATESDAEAPDTNFDAEAYANSILEMAESVDVGDVTVPERTEEEQKEYDEGLMNVKEAQAALREREGGGN